MMILDEASNLWCYFCAIPTHDQGLANGPVKKLAHCR